jgi:IS30 family transposase
MDKRYKHLNGEERGVILAEHRRGASLQAIGLLLGRSASTIGRELLRGRPEGEPAQPYCAAAWLGGVSGAPQALRAAAKACPRRLAACLCARQTDPQALVSRANYAQTEGHAPR